MEMWSNFKSRRGLSAELLDLIIPITETAPHFIPCLWRLFSTRMFPVSTIFHLTLKELNCTWKHFLFIGINSRLRWNARSVCGFCSNKTTTHTWTMVGSETNSTSTSRFRNTSKLCENSVLSPNLYLKRSMPRLENQCIELQDQNTSRTHQCSFFALALVCFGLSFVDTKV
eukprot:07829_6